MMQSVAKTTTPWVVARSKLPIAADRELAEPGQAEDGLGEERSAEREPDVHSENRDDRQQRISDHVVAEHPALGGALGARGANEVLVQRLDHVGTDHARVRRREEDREGAPRQHEVVGPLNRAAAVPVGEKKSQ